MNENFPNMNDVSRGHTGTPGGIRTPNLLIRSQMLYPLSYGRKATPAGAEVSLAGTARLLSQPGF